MSPLICPGVPLNVLSCAGRTSSARLIKEYAYIQPSLDDVRMLRSFVLGKPVGLRRSAAGQVCG